MFVVVVDASDAFGNYKYGDGDDEINDAREINDMKSRILRNVGIEEDIEQLKSNDIMTSFIMAENILSTIGKEYELQYYNNKVMYWDNYPGIAVVRSYLDNMLKNFSKTNLDDNIVMIDEHVNRQTEMKYTMDPGWIKSGYKYYRYYFVHLKETDQTGLIIFRFDVENKHVFLKVSEYVGDVIEGVERIAKDTVYYTIQCTIALCVLTLTFLFIFKCCI